MPSVTGCGMGIGDGGRQAVRHLGGVSVEDETTTELSQRRRSVHRGVKLDEGVEPAPVCIARRRAAEWSYLFNTGEYIWKKKPQKQILNTKNHIVFIIK